VLRARGINRVRDQGQLKFFRYLEQVADFQSQRLCTG
jgi:hypothetical protein